jgi:hypothetical protein
MKDVINSIAASAGISPESVLHIVKGIANKLESEGSAECYINASVEDQQEIAIAYLLDSIRITRAPAIKTVSDPRALNGLCRYVYGRVEQRQSCGSAA